MHLRAVGGLAFAIALLACSSDDTSDSSSDAGHASTDATTQADASPEGASPDGASPDSSFDATAPDAAIPDASAPDVVDHDAAIPSYAVGVLTRTFVDSTRPTPANGSEPAKTSRSLTTEIWYPAASGDPSAAPVRNAAMSTDRPFPLVLFVHGSSSGRTVYTYLTIALAHAGYVVAAADFPLTALGTPGGSSDLHVTDEVGDLSFLCDQINGAGLTPPGSTTNAIDAQHYAVVGHSTGGAVAALAAFAGDDAAIKHDARVAAAIALSGDACMFDASFFKSRSVPIFAIGATNDLFVRLPNSGQWVFDNSNPPHLLAKLVGGQHMGFTDVNLPDGLLNPVPTGPTSPLATTLSAYGDAGACLPEPPGGSDPAMAFDAQHAAVVRLVTAYLEAQLRHRPGPLAAVLAANDPTIVLQQ